MRRYRAPLGTSVVVISGLATVLCVALPYLVGRVGGRGVMWLCPMILGVAALFIVRDYRVAEDCILVRRLFWTTRLPLAGLESARFEPGAMARSLRTFGNGGLFSVTGYYRNKTLGRYRALVTDPCRIVVLRYAGRTVVVSPGEPEAFAAEVTAKLAASGALQGGPKPA